MTNKKAIRVLEHIEYYLKTHTNESCEEEHTAITLAIQALETGEVYMTGEDYNLYMEGYKAGKKDFEPKQGEWILNKDKNPECPFCHHSFTYWGNFCGNCGAKMEGGAE